MRSALWAKSWHRPSWYQRAESKHRDRFIVDVQRLNSVNHEKLLNVSNRRVRDDREKLLVSVVWRPSLKPEWLESSSGFHRNSPSVFVWSSHFFSFFFQYIPVVTCRRMLRYDLTAAPATVQHVAHDFTTRCRKTENDCKRKVTRRHFQKYGDTLNFTGFDFAISIYDIVYLKVN